MKVLVLSDSHGRADTLRRAIEAEKPHAMLYLGDGLSDAERMREEYPLLPITTVPGNCDWGSLEETERLIELDGVRILMLHGHTRGVKYHSMNAYYAAKEMGADVLLYGHTHCPGSWYTSFRHNPPAGSGYVRTISICCLMLSIRIRLQSIGSLIWSFFTFSLSSVSMVSVVLTPISPIIRISSNSS